MATRNVGCVMARVVCEGFVACLDCWTSISWVTAVRKQTWTLTPQAGAGVSYASMYVSAECAISDVRPYFLASLECKQQHPCLFRGCLPYMLCLL